MGTRKTPKSASDPRLDSGLPQNPDVALRQSDEPIDTGETKTDIAFCISLWLIGERFADDSTAFRTALEEGWGHASVKKSTLANELDDIIGPAFDDKGEYVAIGPCFNPFMKGFSPATHPWETYRHTAFDDYYAALVSRLNKNAAEALTERLGGKLPEKSGFNGWEGFSFNGIKASYLRSSENVEQATRWPADALLRGIGPNGELLLQLRRVGGMRFSDYDFYEEYWPVRTRGKKEQHLSADDAPKAHPSEWLLWDTRVKDTILGTDVDKQVKGSLGQTVRRTQRGRDMDYPVCLPYMAAWKLRHRCEPPMGEREAADRLKDLFINAFKDSDHRVFTDAQRQTLNRQIWPAGVFDTAAFIGSALVRYALNEGELFDIVLRMLHDELAPQIAYLRQLQEWASEVIERDGAAPMADRLEDLFVTPHFSQKDSDCNPVNWLLDPNASERLLLQANSSMGKTTFLRATAAACAGVRMGQIALELGDRMNQEEEAAAEFALAFTRGADNDAASFELPGAPETDAGAQPPEKKKAADILADERTAQLTGIGRLASYVPIVLSQTSDGNLYRLLDDDGQGQPVPFSDLAFRALPETMQDALRSAAGPRSTGNPIEALVKRGSVLLLVDSIDEIPRRYRAPYLRRLKEFASQQGIARLLVASRPLPPADDAAMRKLLGTHAWRARLEEFDLPRQEELFARITTRGGADAYNGPDFTSVRATAGFRGVMGNPFMLTAIALAFKRGHSIDSHSVWETFSEINRKFRKRTKLEDYDKAALEHLAFDFAVGDRSMSVSAFTELFRRHRKEEELFRTHAATSDEMDENALMDLIVSRLGIIDIRGDKVGFTYAAICGYWASLWVRHCVERAQQIPDVLMDAQGKRQDEQDALFECGAETGVNLLRRLANASKGSAAPADDAALPTCFGDAALLALLFCLDYAGTPRHTGFPAFDRMLSRAYDDLFLACSRRSDDQAAKAVRVLEEAAVFAFGKPLAGFEIEAEPYLARLSAFSKS